MPDLLKLMNVVSEIDADISNHMKEVHYNKAINDCQ